MVESAYKMAMQIVASVNNALVHDAVDTCQLAMHVPQMITV